MARTGPTIPDDKINYFREQLYRELSNMFRWHNLPKTIPHDYLERTLVRTGRVMFYENENIGHDILRCTIQGYNRHDMPVTATSNVNSTLPSEKNTNISRNIKRLTDSEDAIDNFDPMADCVLINNMERGQSCREIVDHFAERLALAQQAFDTNLLWQNMPHIFLADGHDLKLSYERLWDDIFTGKPGILTDKSIFNYNKLEENASIRLETPYIGKELMDTRNELMMKFRETVGIDTAGVDKAERVGKFEVDSNVQHTKTVLEIMLDQRRIACDDINAFYGYNITVEVVGSEHLEEDEVKDDGDINSGTEEFIED